MARKLSIAALSCPLLLLLGSCGSDPVAGPANPDPTAAEATARAAQARDAATDTKISTPAAPEAPGTTGPEGVAPAKQPVVVAQPVFPITVRGQWALSKSACTDPEGTMRMAVTRSDIHFYETRVTPRAIRDAGKGRFDMDVTEEGEGMTTQTQATIILAQDTNSLTYRERDRDFRYIRCN